MLDRETAMAINEVSRRLTEVERKLDNYFMERHIENSEAIDDILVSILESEVPANEE